MGFKKVIKRIVALGTGASMVGATLMGAMAANLADYPNQFISNGAFTGVLVVGDRAAAEDVVGVSDIAVSLQFAATKPVTVGSAGAVTALGEAWKVGTSTKILEITENLKSGNTPGKETIANITTQSFIDDAELPNLLAPFTASNPKGDAPYDQRLYFEDTNSGYVQFLEDRDDITSDFLYFPSGSQIARYEMEFTTALESDIDDSAGSATSTGLFLTDIEDVELEMLGTTFTVVTAKRTNSAGSGVILTLMGGAIQDTLLEGSTKTYTIGGTDFEVSLDFVDGDSGKFTVNGEGTRDMIDGDTDKLSDGTTIGISEILYQDYAGGVHSVTFFLGAQKMELKDTNIKDTASSNELKVDDETIDGAEVRIEGTDDNTTFKIDKITINMTADDNYYVPAGGKLSENPELDEPDLVFTRGWDIEYRGLSDELVNIIKIRAVGSDDYELEFVDGRGNRVNNLPIAHVPSGSILKFGDNDDDLIVQENKTIRKDSYFIVTDENDKDGERQSFALRYRGADKITSDDPIVKFDDLGSGERIERTISVPSSQLSTSAFGIDLSELAQIKIGGGIFRVYNTTSSASNDFDIVVDLDADQTITGGRVAINTQYGASIDIINDSDVSILVEIRTPNTDDFDDLQPTAILYNISASSSEVRLAVQGGDVHNLITPDDDDDNSFGYTSLGALIRLFKPTSDPQELTIEYPQQQRVPQVFITGSGTTFTQTSATTTDAVTVQRIDVGATKLASEVSNINAVNSILVGGPCANAKSAEVMGNPADCTEGFEPGVGLLQIFDVGSSGNVAMLVAGFAAEDTRNAAAVVANSGDYTFSGDKMEVRRVNNQLTVAAPVAAPADDTSTDDTTTDDTTTT